MKPWDKVEDARFGFKLGVQRAGPNWEGGGIALGWAVIGRQQKITLQSEEATSDPIDRLIEVYRRESAARPGCEGVTLYRYGSKSAFSLSDVARRGTTRAQHDKIIAEAKTKLEAAGVPVIVKVIK